MYSFSFLEQFNFTLANTAACQTLACFFRRLERRSSAAVSSATMVRSSGSKPSKTIAADRVAKSTPTLQNLGEMGWMLNSRERG